MSRVRRPGSLSRQLLTAQIVVAAAMAVTMIGAALIVGPPLFAQHMHEAGHGEQPSVLAHADEAFRAAGLVSLAIGLLISAGGAALISILFTRRIGHSLDDLTTAAQRIASGDYEHRVEDASLSTELSQLAGNFNDMAATLASTEDTRRRLLTDLAHELRTPIATIEICLDSLEDGIVDAGPETIAILRSQTARLTRLTHDLRDVSAAEEGRLNLRLEPSAPADLAHRALLAARDAFAQKGVTLHETLTPSTIPVVDADPARIGQVLANLLSNALRHTPAGGSVTISARQDGDQVVIDVADTGDGIEAAHLPHLFERFYRSDSARDRDHGGSGVGLTISQGIARAHGGTLTAVSAGPGRGATLTLTLPGGGTGPDVPAPTST